MTDPIIKQPKKSEIEYTLVKLPYLLTVMHVKDALEQAYQIKGEFPRVIEFGTKIFFRFLLIYPIHPPNLTVWTIPFRVNPKLGEMEMKLVYPEIIGKE